MRRFVGSLLVVVATALAVVAPLAPTPAAAGERIWTSTACYGELPYNAAWLGTPGVGASYSSVFADYEVDLQWITWNGKGQSYVQLLGETHAHYAAAGYECGRFGLPFQQGLYESRLVTYQWTYFVKPGSCDMRYIIHVYPVLTLEGLAIDYFCQ